MTTPPRDTTVWRGCCETQINAYHRDDCTTFTMDGRRKIVDPEHDEAVAAMGRDTTEAEALGELLALVDDYDGCHARIRDWEALPDYRKTDPSEVAGDREDASWWNRRAEAVIAAGWISPTQAAADRAAQRAEALREAAGEIDLDLGGGQTQADDQRATTAASQWLSERADRIGGAHE